MKNIRAIRGVHTVIQRVKSNGLLTAPLAYVRS